MLFELGQRRGQLHAVRAATDGLRDLRNMVKPKVFQQHGEKDRREERVLGLKAHLVIYHVGSKN